MAEQKKEEKQKSLLTRVAELFAKLNARESTGKPFVTAFMKKTVPEEPSSADLKNAEKTPEAQAQALSAAVLDIEQHLDKKPKQKL